MITKEHLALAGRIKDLMAAYRENEDIIQIGAYAAGSSERVDKSIKAHDALESFLRQDRAEKSDFGTTLKRLREIDALVASAKPKQNQAQQSK